MAVTGMPNGAEDNDKRDEEDWEKVCRRCGECCFEKKLGANGAILTTRVPCRFLDIHSRTCRIYPQRLTTEEDCIRLTPDNVRNLDWLPENCAYRQDDERLKRLCRHSRSGGRAGHRHNGR